jgi:RimJ/RimL family protein N-acetyltransferase
MTMTTLISAGSFDVRIATQDDKDAILAVYRQCEDFLALGPQLNATMTMVLRDLELSRQQGAFFCGIHDAAGRMVGVVDFTPGGFEGKPGVAFISLVMLVPGLRGRGVGTEAVRLIEREIRKDRRVTAIGSAVQVNNPRAERFWLRHGYRITGGPELQPDGTTVFHLQKDCSQGG